MTNKHPNLVEVGTSSWELQTCLRILELEEDLEIIDREFDGSRIKRLIRSVFGRFSKDQCNRVLQQSLNSCRKSVQDAKVDRQLSAEISACEEEMDMIETELKDLVDTFSVHSATTSKIAKLSEIELFFPQHSIPVFILEMLKDRQEARSHKRSSFRKNFLFSNSRLLCLSCVRTSQSNSKLLSGQHLSSMAKKSTKSIVKAQTV